MTDSPTSFINSIGDSETVDSASFADRKDKLFHPYDGTRCPPEDKKWHWSELKSSFLFQAILSNSEIQDRLLKVIRDNILTIYRTTDKEQQFYSDFTMFSEKLLDTPQFGPFDTYPLAQGPAYAGNPTKAWNDILIIFNFVKFVVWYNDEQKSLPSIVNGGLWDPNKCNLELIVQYLILNVIMNPIYNFFGMVRGNREDFRWSTEEYDQALWDQVGITYILHPILKRSLPEFPEYAIKKWLHSGNAQCRMPYWGKWGERIRHAREENTVWGSLLCGLSGSTQFVYFYFLLARAFEPTSDPHEDVVSIFVMAAGLLSCGHNVRETVYGITLTTIILYLILDSITTELQNIFGNSENLQHNAELFRGLDPSNIMPEVLIGIPIEPSSSESSGIPEDIIGGLRAPEIPSGIPVGEAVIDTITGEMGSATVSSDKNVTLGPLLSAVLSRINRDIQTLTCYVPNELIDDIPKRNKYLLQRFITVCGNWEPIVKEAYTMTSHLNITGVTEKDLLDYDPMILEIDNEVYENYKISAIEYFFGIENSIFPIGESNVSKKFNNNVQILLALQNNRYKRDNWQEGANEFMESLISKNYTQGPQLLDKIDKLMDERLEECGQTIKTIPFAFPGSN